jgi:hypothetical protein
MQWLRVHRSNIPIKYLGLPLSTLSLKTIDVHSPMDKVGPKLFSLAWKIYRCSLNEQVVWSSVTSQVIYHTTQLVIPCSFFNPSKFREGILFGVVDKVYRVPSLFSIHRNLERGFFLGWWIRFIELNARSIGKLFVHTRRKEAYP